jgi:hypothetical protein
MANELVTGAPTLIVGFVEPAAVRLPPNTEAERPDEVTDLIGNAVTVERFSDSLLPLEILHLLSSTESSAAVNHSAADS